MSEINGKFKGDIGEKYKNEFVWECDYGFIFYVLDFPNMAVEFCTSDFNSGGTL